MSLCLATLIVSALSFAAILLSALYVHLKAFKYTPSDPLTPVGAAGMPPYMPTGPFHLRALDHSAFGECGSAIKLQSIDEVLAHQLFAQYRGQSGFVGFWVSSDPITNHGKVYAKFSINGIESMEDIAEVSYPEFLVHWLIERGVYAA